MPVRARRTATIYSREAAAMGDTRLTPFLEALHRRLHRPEFLGSDPLVFAHGWARREDGEIAAVFAALLAYGRVDVMTRTLRPLLESLGPHPAEVLRGASFASLERIFSGRYYRLHDSCDFALLGWSLGQAVANHGSLGALWQKSVDAADDLDPASDFIPALARWRDALLAPALADPSLAPLVDGKSFRHLLPDPTKGSGCKRLAMLLRWMIRSDDGIDLGWWQSARSSPARLLMPVDTHVLRFSQHLGLIDDAKTASLATSRAITARLRRLVPTDPTRFDFSLARLGILAECPSRERLELCAHCELSPVCRRRATLAGEFA